MRVYVTARDIAFGERAVPERCPLARAARRRYPAGSSVWVGAVNLHVDEDWYPLPPAALRFMRLYDALGPAAVRPVTFTL